MFDCTKERPWQNGDPTPVFHADAVEVGEQEGDFQKFKCPHCGTTFKEELAQ